jgi:L-seryl-tRNA(Ser) seleniumtransferase
MARALRVDKMVLAALDATLRSYQRGRAVAEVPVWQMIDATPAQLAQRAESWQTVLADAGVSSQLLDGESAIGGGSLPGETLPTRLLSLPVESPVESPDDAAVALRAQAIPVVCRIQQDCLLFDPRTVLPEQDAQLISAIVALFRQDDSEHDDGGRESRL